MLLALLAIGQGQSIPSDVMVEALWGDDLPAKPSTALQIQISRLRSALPEDVIETTDSGYRLSTGVDVDASTYRRLIDQARDFVKAGQADESISAFRGADRLWSGRVLQDIPGFEQVTAAVVELEQLRLAAHEERYRYQLDQRIEEAELTADLERLVRDNPLHEGFAALLMQSLYRNGRQSDALSCYAALRKTLLDDLGVAPSPELQDLELAILTHDDRLRTGTEAPTRPGAAPPTPITSFFGRDDETSEMAGLIDAHRLVTVVGPGGMGKTRLAVRLFEECRDRFTHNAWFVPLSAVTVPDLVPIAVATALGLETTTGMEPMRLIERHLRRWDALLVLDNCEQVSEAAAEFVKEVLSFAPGVSVLATSREPLRLQGERVFRLDGLEVGGHAGGPAESLFLDRSSLVSDQEMPVASVTAVCRLVDGWPLALELIAANSDRVMVDVAVGEIEGLLLGVDSPFRDTAERQRSLAATLDWSVGLLAVEQRAAYRALSVFDGMITVEATAAALDCGPSEAERVLVDLSSRSLLTLDPDSLTATMLRPVIQYGRELLAVDLEESSKVSRRFIEWFGSFADEANNSYASAEAGAWLERVGQVEANITRAMTLAIEAGLEERAARICIDMGYYWLLTSTQPAGLVWVERIVAGAFDKVDWEVRSQLLQVAGFLTGSMGNHSASRGHLEAALAIREENDDPNRLTTLSNLSNILEISLDLQGALSHIESAGDLLPEVAESAPIERIRDIECALGINRSSLLFALGRYEEARTAAETALGSARDLASDQWGYMAHLSLGYVHTALGRFDDARSFLDLASQASDRLGEFHGWELLTYRAILALASDDIEEAMELLGEGALKTPEHEYYDIVSGLKWRAEAQLRTGESRAASSTIQHGLRLAVEREFADMAVGLVDQSADVLMLQGRLDDAELLGSVSKVITDRSGLVLYRAGASPRTGGHPASGIDPGITAGAAGRLALELLDSLSS